MLTHLKRNFIPFLLLSYIPKRTDYYTSYGFHELGYTDMSKYGWEEFLWKKKPFGLHIRGAKTGTLEYEYQIDKLIHALANLTGLNLSIQ